MQFLHQQKAIGLILSTLIYPIQGFLDILDKLRILGVDDADRMLICFRSYMSIVEMF